jgi:hypothetical protein
MEASASLRQCNPEHVLAPVCTIVMTTKGLSICALASLWLEDGGKFVAAPWLAGWLAGCDCTNDRTMEEGVGRRAVSCFRLVTHVQQSSRFHFISELSERRCSCGTSHSCAARVLVKETAVNGKNAHELMLLLQKCHRYISGKTLKAPCCIRPSTYIVHHGLLAAILHPCLRFSSKSLPSRSQETKWSQRAITQMGPLLCICFFKAPLLLISL